jgi:hypothetical protein
LPHNVKAAGGSANLTVTSDSAGASTMSYNVYINVENSLDNNNESHGGEGTLIKVIVLSMNKTANGKATNQI